jgi:hypothetical protein
MHEEPPSVKPSGPSEEQRKSGCIAEPEVAVLTRNVEIDGRLAVAAAVLLG